MRVACVTLTLLRFVDFTFAVVDFAFVCVTFAVAVTHDIRVHVTRVTVTLI